MRHAVPPMVQPRAAPAVHCRVRFDSRADAVTVFPRFWDMSTSPPRPSPAVTGLHPYYETGKLVTVCIAPGMIPAGVYAASNSAGG